MTGAGTERYLVSVRTSIPNPVAALLEPGYRLDRYELLAKIGQGGMASVWLARTEDGAFFAVKTILPQHSTDEQLRKMMLDEARIAMAIDHPNVARTLETGQLWDMPYLVLEYVPGESLDQLCQALSSKGLHVPPEIAVRIVSDTCAGLHAAHELTGPDGKNLEIVHRDLSPHNILIDERGMVKLIDFGVAKASQRLAETASGVTKGKVPYMAPEQALDAFVDRRADLWALGAVLYVLLSGKYPFDGPNDAARLVRKLSGDPPAPLPASVPKELADVVERTLSFYREQRYASAAELGAALDESIPKASKKEVAEFFAKNLGPAMKARGLIVEHALAAGNARARAKEMLGGSGAPSSRRRGATTMPPAAAQPSGIDEGPSVSTIGGPKKPAPSARPWIAYVSAAAITLIIIVAFVLGSQNGRGGATTPPLTDDGVDARPRATATTTPGTNEPAMVPRVTIGSAAPSASASASAAPAATTKPGYPPTAVTAPPLPPAASTAAPPSASASAHPPKPRPSAEDTIF